jgi:thymidylate synthase (FAD)
VLEGEDAARVLGLLRQDSEQTYAHYEEMLDEDGPGLARELARMNLTLNTYTQWYWKTDLHNLFHFLRLRADAHAQYEIRVYAEAMLETVKAWVPLSYGAFTDYRLGAVTFSAKMVGILTRMLAGEDVSQAESGLSKREWGEMMGALGR